MECGSTTRPILRPCLEVALTNGPSQGRRIDFKIVLKDKIATFVGCRSIQ